MTRFLVLLSILFVSNGNKVQRKIINSPDFNYEFYVYVSPKDLKVKSDITYFWFKSGEIHSSSSAASGNVLHDKFQKFFKSYQLAEEGNFNRGLKVGTWRKWYENGNLKEVSNYKKGVRHGKYFHFDLDGDYIDKGRYSKGEKHGKWLENGSDTLKYRRGEVKVKDTANSFFKKLKRFFKKEKLENKKELKEKPKRSKHKIKQQSDQNPDKNGLLNKFLNLFKSKNKDEKN